MTLQMFRADSQVRMVVIDVETGGLDPERDALLSIGAVDSMTKERFYSRMRPLESLRVYEAALKANGFERKSLFDSELLSELQCMEEFRAWLFLHGPAVIAGCNVKFDIAFINAALTRSLINDDQLTRHAFDLQTLALTAHILGAIELPIKHDMPSMSLDSILSTVGLSRSAGGHVHNALEDAALTLSAIELILLNLIPTEGIAS